MPSVVTDFFQVAERRLDIESVVSEIDIFAFLTVHCNITALDHMKKLKNMAFVGNTEHFQDSVVKSILFVVQVDV